MILIGVQVVLRSLKYDIGGTQTASTDEHESLIGIVDFVALISESQKWLLVCAGGDLPDGQRTQKK